MTTYFRRMIGVIRSEGSGAAYDLAKRDKLKRQAKRKTARASRKRNRERGISEGGIIVLVVLATLISIPAVWAIRYYTADTRGKIDANEKVKADGNYRLEAYDRFFNQCASVQSIEATINATKAELVTAKDPRRVGQLQTNLTALTAARADAVNTYNADSRKTATAGQFKSSDLPYELPTTMPTEGTTSCTA